MLNCWKVIATGILSAGTSWIIFNQPQFAKSSDAPSVDDDLAFSPKIAIIGSGIGGSSASHFLRELFGPFIKIDVFEKAEKIGGRMSVVELNGHQVESGGTIIHDKNKYMVDFARDLGLETFKGDEKSDTLGIYNGQEFVFTTSRNSFITKLKMVWRYGLFTLWHLDQSLTEMLSKFHSIYSLQENGNSYQSVPDMLRAMGGQRFVEYTQKTVEEVMLDQGISKRLIHELVTAANRCNYGQDAGVNAFTGYVSMAGVQDGDLFSVKGGNFQVCKRLLKNAETNLFLNEQVTAIRKERIDRKIVYYLDKLGGSSSGPYHSVIVAAPLEVPSCYLECEKCTHWPKQNEFGHYQQTIATFIQAYANYKHFGFETFQDMPSTIFTTEEKSLKYSTIATQLDTNGDEIEKPPLYKVFSRQKLSDDTVKELFELKKDTKIATVGWLAYPHYTPPEKFAPFVLDDGVFYVNAIERAASAMEMSAIGGRNAALLVKKYLTETFN